jgi:hypothetical protein
VDQSEVKRIVEAHGPAYERMFRLEQWEIMYEYGPVTGGDSAECERNLPYNQATIRIDPVLMRDEAEVVETLRHELEHIIHAPFDALWFALAIGLEGVEREKAEYHRTLASEQTRLSIERMYLGVLRECSEMAKKKKADLPPEFVKHMGRMSGDKPKPPGAAPKGKAASKKKGT